VKCSRRAEGRDCIAFVYLALSAAVGLRLHLYVVVTAQRADLNLEDSPPTVE
jgi:hypothetical protein